MAIVLPSVLSLNFNSVLEESLGIGAAWNVACIAHSTSQSDFYTEIRRRFARSAAYWIWKKPDFSAPCLSG